MCLLAVLIGLDAAYPIFVASNRDERKDRASAPPGLHVGERRRMLSPRDRLKGGTWLAVSDLGLLAGITNIAGQPLDPSANSRGELPHLALDADTLDAAAEAVAAAVGAARYNAFQLVLCDGKRAVVLRWSGGQLARHESRGPLLVVTNEHAPGELPAAPFEPALEPGLQPAQRFARLLPILRDDGRLTGHRVLKHGAEYGTVSSSLIGVRAGDPRALIWEYAAGAPDAVTFKSYGNLGRRLLG